MFRSRNHFRVPSFKIGPVIIFVIAAVLIGGLAVLAVIDPSPDGEALRSPGHQGMNHPIRVAAFGLAVLLAFPVLAQTAAAQTAAFDNQPSGFLTVPTGGMAPDAWSGTSLGTAKRLVAALPAAPHSRALRDLQFQVLVSRLALPAADNSPPPSLVSRTVDRMAAMGEGESLNELVRSVDGYSDPWVGTITSNALMMAAERASACNIVAHYPPPPPFGPRAEIACKLAAGDSAGAMEAAAELRGNDGGLATLARVAAGSLPPSATPLNPLDGPAMMMLDLAHVVPPASVLQSTQPPMIRALVGHRTLPLADPHRASPSAARRWPSSKRPASATSMCRLSRKVRPCRPRWPSARSSCGGCATPRTRRNSWPGSPRPMPPNVAARCSRQWRAPRRSAC